MTSMQVSPSATAAVAILTPEMEKALEFCETDLGSNREAVLPE
jgi:hypothetical protein